MERGSSDGEKKAPERGGGSGGEPKTKRKMKTPSQLQVLENSYKVEANPSEALRAELSVQLGLTDRQLQMWFCHRRLKDRKGPSSGSGKRSRKGEGMASVAAGASGPAVAGTPPLLPPSVSSKDEMLGGEFGNEHGSGSRSGSGSSPYGHADPHMGYPVNPGVAVLRTSGRYYEPSAQSVVELRVIQFVVAQLGEPLREDGPALGMEFDPLPPGAFGAPMAMSGAPQKSVSRSFEAAMYERADIKSVKGSGKALHEYQFLLEQPTVTESYKRVRQNHYYGSPSDGPGTKTPPLSGGRSYMHGYEDVPVTSGLPNQTPVLSLASQQGKSGSIMPSTSGDYDSIARKSPYSGMESPFNAHSVAGLDNTLVPSEICVTQEDEAVRLERKRKSEEARMAKEIEANEKRMRKELEKQDIMRRKREEQMRKEMERQDRERRKEEERLLREKQREEERYQREQKREIERREKYLLKESVRAEKMRQKEELRREREAARQKAANDRALARRLVKESMDLIEDERLELMEIAASKKGLTSIVALDSETLQNLDTFRGMLRLFPPKSVQLKKPFAILPWMDSEENVGNLLMAWKFLITFTDVLGLWPFTLDEFVQAFHDCDHRLLGEIHVNLLRTIIKDIEDVARTPSMGLGVNQNSVANPGGGHPHIVEGAYSWGFDIRSWQQNLSPLTWPEILRQFSLSAGFGPKLKKRNVEQAYSREDEEGDDGNDIISNLRTGAAVENAVAIMRERGYSNPRKSRHRLTPGTVKFAAFYVLALEGGAGLNILEVADRIQKSGLRDLTTSKTPEASIAVALSRDTKLFEKTAPSTYCLRAPYRKDPADAEAILSAAREKIRVFKSGLVDGVEADVDVVLADEVEKDDDSESDTAEDPEVDDLAAESTPNKDVNSTSYDVNSASYDGNRYEAEVHTADVKVNLHDSSVDDKPNGLGNASDSLPLAHMECLKDLNNDGCSVEGNSRNFRDGTLTDHEDTEIDESCPGEPWVHGLVEGDYSILSVEERLNALAALIGVANEGNSIRVVLEERLESANALKKQMWAEAQLDKRRMKVEYFMRTPYGMFAPNKIESAPDNRISMFALDNNDINDNNMHAELNSEKNFATPEFAMGSDNLALQQSVYAERCRAQLKSYIGHKAEEMYVYRSLPLGQDRRRNRYWQFSASLSCNDPGARRIFVELYNGGWRLIDSEEAFDALLASLDVRGVRESHLHALLQKIEPFFKESVRKKLSNTIMDVQNEVSVKVEVSETPSNPESSGGTDSPSSTICASNSRMPEPSSSFQIECSRNSSEIKNALRRYRDFEEWIWRECFSSSALCATKYGKKRGTQLVGICESCHDIYFYEDNHCHTCHATYTAFDKSFNFSEHTAQCQETKAIQQTFQRLDYPPPRIRLLKAFLALVEVCIPSEALQPVWSDSCRQSWGMKLHMSSSAENLLEVLTLLEGGIKRDFLSPNFQTTSELLVSGNTTSYVLNDASNFGDVTLLPWIPQTSSAVALRLMELDSAIAYLSEQKLEFSKDAESRQFLLPSKYSVLRNVQEDEFGGPYVEHLQDAWLDRGSEHGLASMRGGRGRGRGRSRGGGSHRRVVGSRGAPSRSLVSTERNGQVIRGWNSRSNRGKGGRKRGRRSARSRQKPKKAPAVAGLSNRPEPILFDKSSPGFSSRDHWNVDESRQMQAEKVDVNDDSNSDRSDYDEGNGQASGDDYDDIAIDDYAAVYNGKPSHLMDDDYIVEGDEDEDDDDGEVGDDADEDVDVGQGDMDVGGYFNADTDDEGSRDEDGERDRDQDDFSESASTDFSNSSE